MKYKYTPLFSKIFVIAPYSLHKTRSQLIKVKPQSIKKITPETQAQPMKLFPLFRFYYRSLSHIFPIDTFNKELYTTKYLKNGRPESLQYGYKDVVLNRASPEALIFVHSVAHSAIKVGSPEDIEFCPKSLLKI